MNDETNELRQMGAGQVILAMSPRINPYPGLRISALTVLFNRAMDCAAKGQLESAKNKLTAIGLVRIHDPNPLVRAWAEHCRKMLYSNSPAERLALALNKPRDPNDTENSKTDAEIAALVEQSA